MAIKSPLLPSAKKVKNSIINNYAASANFACFYIKNPRFCTYFGSFSNCRFSHNFSVL